MFIVRKEAEDDIQSAFEWYENQQRNLGKAFVGELESKFIQIEESPDLYLVFKDGIRRALCNKFPYSIYFLQKHKNIIVIGVLHQRRNPMEWQARIPNQ